MEYSFFWTNGACSNHNATFCADLSRYPIEHVNALLAKEGSNFFDQFDIDRVENRYRTYNNSSSLKINYRKNNHEEQEMCDSYTEIIYPTEAQRRDESWLFVLNTNRQQSVRIRKCRSAGSQCLMADSFPLQYRSKCKQEYMYRELVALSPDGKFTKESFKLPVACLCTLYIAHRIS